MIVTLTFIATQLVITACTAIALTHIARLVVAHSAFDFGSDVRRRLGLPPKPRITYELVAITHEENP